MSWPVPWQTLRTKTSPRRWVEGFTPSIESITEGLVEAGFSDKGSSVLLLEERVLVAVSEDFVMVCRVDSEFYEAVSFEEYQNIWNAIRRAWDHVD